MTDPRPPAWGIPVISRMPTDYERWQATRTLGDALAWGAKAAIWFAALISVAYFGVTR